MRVLLDENLPHDLVSELDGLDVVTGHVAAFITMDRKLEREHDLTELPFGVVVVRTRSNRVQDLRPLVGAIREALARSRPGRVEQVGA